MRYLYFIFLLIGCNSNKDNNFLEKDGNIAIPLKENSSTEGHFVEDNKDMVFSYSKMSKKLFIYDGYKVVDSLNLHKLNLEANQIVVKNTDSIFIIDYNTRLIKHINIKGDVINELNLHKLSKQDTINPYLFKNAEAINSKNIILDVGIVNDKFKHLTHQQKIVKYKSFPRFISISNNNILFPNFSYKNVEEITQKVPEDLFVDYSNISLSKKYIVYSMQFSNQLFVFDYDLQLLKTIPIQSDFTGTDINSDYSFYNLLKNSNERGEIYVKNYDYATLTKYVVYNKHKNRFYILLAHKTDISKNENLIYKRNNRDFSIIEYDEEFNKLNEQKFKKGLYDIYKPMFINKEGNLLLNANNELKSNYSPDTLRYDIYKITK